MNNQYFKGYSTKYDIRGLFKGNDLSLVIEARDSTTGTAAPFDFTYYDATFKVYQKGNNRLILDLTPTLATGTDIDTDPSTITVTDAAITVNAGVYQYALNLINASSQVQTWLFGDFEVWNQEGINNKSYTYNLTDTTIEVVNLDTTIITLNLL
jgi:hypothetical protein